MSALEREAEQAMAEMQGLARGTLTVGASLTVGAYVMPELLASTGGATPTSRCTLEIANTEAIQRRLLEGELDIGLTEGLGDAPDLEAARLSARMNWSPSPRRTIPLLLGSAGARRRACAGSR